VFVYDEAARHQIAADRIERITDDYARAAQTRRRRLRWDLLLAAGMQLVERKRRSAQRSPLRV
jgi:hypothetical protein